MSELEIVNIVCMVVWALCLGAAMWMFVSATKARQKAYQILTDVEQKAAAFEYKFGKSITTIELLDLFAEDQLIISDMLPMSKVQFIEENPDKLTLFVESIHVWINPEKNETAIQFKWVDKNEN